MPSLAGCSPWSPAINAEASAIPSWIFNRPSRNRASTREVRRDFEISPRGARPPVVDQNDLCRHYSHSTENIEDGRSILCAADNKFDVFTIPESRPFKNASHVIDHVRIGHTETKPLQMYNLEQPRKINVIDPVHDSDYGRIMELTKIDPNDVSLANRIRAWLYSVIHWIGCWKNHIAYPFPPANQTRSSSASRTCITVLLQPSPARTAFPRRL